MGRQRDCKWAIRCCVVLDWVPVTQDCSFVTMEEEEEEEADPGREVAGAVGKGKGLVVGKQMAKHAVLDQGPTRSGPHSAGLAICKDEVGGGRTR